MDFIYVRVSHKYFLDSILNHQDFRYNVTYSVILKFEKSNMFRSVGRCGEHLFVENNSLDQPGLMYLYSTLLAVIED